MFDWLRYSYGHLKGGDGKLSSVSSFPHPNHPWTFDLFTIYSADLKKHIDRINIRIS